MQRLGLKYIEKSTKIDTYLNFYSTEFVNKIMLFYVLQKNQVIYSRYIQII